jgi:hypothetical protein
MCVLVEPEADRVLWCHVRKLLVVDVLGVRDEAPPPVRVVGRTD